MAVAQSIWKLAFRNLSSQNTTTILTVAAIAVCVMTFVSIFSILDGLQLTIQGVIKGYYGQGRRIILLTSEGSEQFLESSIPQEVAQEYGQLPEIYGVSMEALAESTYRDIVIDLVGIDSNGFRRVHVLQDLDGRMIEGPGECMVGTTLAQSTGIHIGSVLHVAVEGTQADLMVVGVFVSNTTIDTQIVVDHGYLSSLVPRFSTNTSILRIRLQRSEDIQSIVEYTETHHPELQIREARQVSKFFEKSIINVTRLLSTIIVFVILLMVLGIYNSMNMVVSERTWEIGVIRAMGARRSFVLKLFVAESAMLALLGGLFGVALGVAMSHGITSFFSIFVPGSPTVAPLTKITTIGLGIAASLCIGLIGGMFPASRASKIEISQALAEG